jgi:predicted N-acetyltransferase YhbS
MPVTLRLYQPASDFSPIREMLVDAYPAFDQLSNWSLVRWNTARYFVAPLYYGRHLRSTTTEHSRRGIYIWESRIGVWENGGEVVGVALSEYPWDGEAFLLRRPGYAFLLDEMLRYAEETFTDPTTHTLRVHIYDADDSLQAAAQRRGYQRDEAHPEWDTVLNVRDIPAPRLPPSYTIRSMADDNDIARRCEVMGRAFNHTDPAEWATEFTYRELQKAPDYRPDQDLYVVSPEGQWVSLCTVWYDECNRMGMLEPVGTHPDFRRRGLGREVVMEAARRVKARGAERVWVGADQPFYLAIGFQRVCVSYCWVKGA